MMKDGSRVKLLEEGYLTFTACILSLFIIPVHVRYLPPVMILWMICWIIENYSKSGQLKNLRKDYLMLFAMFIAYYAWQAISLLYSTDVRMGFLNLFGRLSMVLFPLVLIFPGNMIRNNIKKLIRIFALGTILFIIFCYCYALYRSLSYQNGLWIFDPHPAKYPWLSYFYGEDLVISHHPSYISIYVLLSAFISFEAWFDHSASKKIRIFWLLAGVLLIISQYFLSSRAGILVTIMLLPVYIARVFNRFEKRKFGWILALFLLFCLIPVLLNNQRVDYLIGRFVPRTDYERKEDPRFMIWRSAFMIAKENILLGVGTGDARNELKSKYKMTGESLLAEENYNAHNQFIETLLENGIIGLSLFLSIIGLMIYIAFRDRNLLYVLFILMVLSFFMFETVLYRLAGVSFFSLFSFLLLYVRKVKQGS